MDLSRFLNTSIDLSASFVQRVVRVPKNAIREVIRNMPHEFFFFESLKRSPLVIEPDWFHPEVSNTNVEFRNYLLRTFAPNQFRTLETSCYLFVEKIRDHQYLPMNNLSEGIRNFYEAVNERANQYIPIDDNFSNQQLLNQVESFITAHIHSIFCPKLDDEALNVSLQDWIRSLHWVTKGFLDTVLDHKSQRVDELIHEAIVVISKLNTYVKVRDKFKCVSRCVKKIEKAIRESTRKPASADEIMPVLTYVILSANPTMLISNLMFMQHFSLKFRTEQGRSGYDFVSLQSAVKFVQELNAESLSIAPEDFERLFETHTPS